MKKQIHRWISKLKGLFQTERQRLSGCYFDGFSHGLMAESTAELKRTILEWAVNIPKYEPVKSRQVSYIMGMSAALKRRAIQEELNK
jgi:hypothetical protein